MIIYCIASHRVTNAYIYPKRVELNRKGFVITSSSFWYSFVVCQCHMLNLSARFFVFVVTMNRYVPITLPMSPHSLWRDPSHPLIVSSPHLRETSREVTLQPKLAFQESARLLKTLNVS